MSFAKKANNGRSAAGVGLPGNVLPSCSHRRAAPSLVCLYMNNYEAAADSLKRQRSDPPLDLVAVFLPCATLHLSPERFLSQTRAWAKGLEAWRPQCSAECGREYSQHSPPLTPIPAQDGVTLFAVDA